MSPNTTLHMGFSQRWSCPKHGPTEVVMEIRVGDETIDGAYCQRCLCEFVAERFPKLEKVVEKP